jgi:hypothetical protein
MLVGYCSVFSLPMNSLSLNQRALPTVDLIAWTTGFCFNLKINQTTAAREGLRNGAIVCAVLIPRKAAPGMDGCSLL